MPYKFSISSCYVAKWIRTWLCGGELFCHKTWGFFLCKKKFWLFYEKNMDSQIFPKLWKNNSSVYFNLLGQLLPDAVKDRSSMAKPPFVAWPSNIRRNGPRDASTPTWAGIHAGRVVSMFRASRLHIWRKRETELI